MICKKCGHKLPEDSEFCQYCGYRITRNYNKLDGTKSKGARKQVTVVGTSNSNSSNKNINASANMGYSQLDIANIIVLTIPLILSIIELFAYNYKGLYVGVFCFSAIVIFIKLLGILGSVWDIGKIKSKIIDVFAAFSLAAALIPFLAEEMWLENVAITVVTLLLVLYVLICDLYKLFLCQVFLFFAKKYYGTQGYRMKCYKRINLINEYREKGVITEEEFEKARKQILNKIR